jgi:hypothetical protein
VKCLDLTDPVLWPKWPPRRPYAIGAARRFLLRGFQFLGRKFPKNRVYARAQRALQKIGLPYEKSSLVHSRAARLTKNRVCARRVYACLRGSRARSIQDLRKIESTLARSAPYKKSGLRSPLNRNLSQAVVSSWRNVGSNTIVPLWCRRSNARLLRDR